MKYVHDYNFNFKKWTNKSLLSATNVLLLFRNDFNTFDRDIACMQFIRAMIMQYTYITHHIRIDIYFINPLGCQQISHIINVIVDSQVTFLVVF